MTSSAAGSDSSPVQVILSLGSNVGDRRGHLERGVRFLAERLHLTGISRVVDSEPWGPVAQPRFLNLVLRGETGLEPMGLLDVLQAAERDAGRTRVVHMGPRTLDVDLILYGSKRIRRPALTVPHPHWRERPFVAALAQDVAGDLTDPETGRSLAAIGADWAPSGRLPPGMTEVEPITIPVRLGTPAEALPPEART